jgi:hypothetical protein
MKKITQKPLSWALALMCSVGLTTLNASAQDIYQDYDFDVPAESQISRPVDDLLMGRTVHTQPEGTLQMSLGGSHDRDEGVSRFSQVRARAEYGITDRLQAQVGLPFQISDQAGNFDAQTDIGDVEVGAMYSILRGDDPISLSTGLNVEIPVGEQMNEQDVMNRDQTLWKPSLVVAKDLGPTQVHANVEGILGGNEDGLNYDIGAVYPMGRVAPTLEFNARTTESASPELYLTPGLFYNFSNRAEIGLGAAVGVNERADDARIMAKFNFQF